MRTDALVPVEVLDKSDWTLAAISARQIDTPVLTHLLIATLVHVLTRLSTRVGLVASRARAAETARHIVTRAQRTTQVARLTALVHIYACTKAH